MKKKKGIFAKSASEFYLLLGFSSVSPSWSLPDYNHKENINMCCK